MSHLIEKGTHFAFRGHPAWHELGVKLDVINRQTLTESTEWCHHVEKLAYLYQDGTETTPHTPATSAFYLRTSDGHILNQNVGKDYTVLQCDDILNIAEPLFNLYDVETAGRLANGRKMFIVFKLKEQVKMSNTDVIDNYVVLMDSRDGSAPRLYLTPVRVVCNNTLQLSLNQIKAQSKALRHTANIVGRINDAVVEMGLLEEQAQRIESVFSVMLNQEVNLVQMVGDLFLPADQYKELFDNGKISAQSRNKLTEVLSHVSAGVGQDGSNSGWNAYNGITHYLSHQEYKLPKTTVYNTANERRMDGLLWGSEATKGRAAMDYVLNAPKVNHDFVNRLTDAIYN